MIESYNTSKKEIRKNVKLSVDMKEPDINWKQYGLDSNLNDDRILGFIIERKNTDDVLITNDSTPRIKGKEIGMSVMKLGCEMLPDPKNEERKEFERMKNQLQKLQNKIPDLSIQLISEETQDNLPKFSIKVISNLSTEQIEEMVLKKEQELNIDLSPSPFVIPAFMIDTEGYQSDVKKYLDLYKTYLVASNPIKQELSTILKMDFVLLCEQSPAEEVHCSIEFPEGFEICKQSDLPEMPPEPTSPKPMTIFEKSIFGMKLPTMPLLGTFPNLINPISESNVTLNFTSNVIQANITKINHGFEITLCTVYVKIPSLNHAKNFEISYTIHALNLPEPKQTIIPVIVEKIE